MADPAAITAGAPDRVRAVLRAEIDWIRARERLSAIQDAALRFEPYDSNAYDEAIIAHRAARAWATIVRGAWRCWHAELGQADGVALR
jgi:hypothetical protein